MAVTVRYLNWYLEEEMRWMKTNKWLNRPSWSLILRRCILWRLCWWDLNLTPGSGITPVLCGIALRLPAHVHSLIRPGFGTVPRCLPSWWQWPRTSNASLGWYTSCLSFWERRILSRLDMLWSHPGWFTVTLELLWKIIWKIQLQQTHSLRPVE